MFQALGLFEDLSVADNLSFANDQSQNPKKQGDWITWRDDNLKSLKLDQSLLHEAVSSLSGGQRLSLLYRLRADCRRAAYLCNCLLF